MLRIVLSFFVFALGALVCLRLSLIYPPLVETLLADERSVHTAALASFRNEGNTAAAGAAVLLPWTSVADLEKQHGAGRNLTGSAVRDLYKTTLLDDKLHTWVETQLANNSASDAQEAFTASSCAMMRHQAKLYSRQRHNLHPFSTEFLAWRDVWVHGVQKRSWRNVVSCLAQHEGYACPVLLDKFRQSVSAAARSSSDDAGGASEHKAELSMKGEQPMVPEGGKNDNDAAASAAKSAKKGAHLMSWVKSTLKSCRRSNAWWDEAITKTKDKNEVHEEPAV